MATGIRIRFRRDTAANWSSVNPILESGELGYVTDLGQFKIGNGSAAWNSLSFFTPGSEDGGTLPDSDWVLSQVGSGGGTTSLDSEWVLSQISNPSSVDSDWVLGQVGDTNSYFYQTLLQTLSADSDEPIASIAAGSMPDSEWVLSQIGGGVTTQVDSEWVLGQISNPSSVDSDWVLGQVGDTNSYFYQTLLNTLAADSEEPIASIAAGSMPDSEWVLTILDSEIAVLTNADSDLGARVTLLEAGTGLTIDSDSVMTHFQESSMVWYVDPNGYDGGVRSGQSILQPLKTVQAGVDRLGQGDSLVLQNGRYLENVVIDSENRNIVITGISGSHSAGSVIQVDSITSTGQTGLKLSNFRINNASSFENTDESPAASNIGNHYNDMLFNAPVTFSGDYFHESRNCKFNNITMSGAGGKYIYNSEIEGSITASNSAGSVVFIQGGTSGAVTVTGAGSVFVMKDVTSGTAGNTISIGAGVVYQLNNLTGFNVSINAGAVSIEDYLVSQGTPRDAAENASTTFFEQLRIGNLKQHNISTDTATPKYLVVDSDNNIRWAEVVASTFSGSSNFVAKTDYDSDIRVLQNVDSDFNASAVTELNDLNDAKVKGTWQYSIGYSSGGNYLNDTYIHSFGSYSGWQNTTGQANTYFGYSTGSYVTTGSNNTAMGYEANRYPTGSNNTAIGYRALKASSGNASANNTALGVNAGSTISGNVSQNVLIGVAAGQQLTNADYNTVVGSGAGSVLSGDNNILLGYNAEPSVTSASNEITLGNANITRMRIPGLGFDTNDGTEGQYIGWDSDGTGGVALSWKSIQSNEVQLEINSLTNVNTVTPSHGDILAWDSDQAAWINIDLDARIQAYLDRVAQDGGSA